MGLRGEQRGPHSVDVLLREGARDLQQLRGETQPSWVHQRNLGKALKDEQAQQVGRVGGFLSVWHWNHW